MRERNLALLGITIFLIAILGFILIPDSVKSVDRPTVLIPTETSNSGEVYSVKSIQVISGNEFDLKLENGKRIHALLAVRATPDSRERVIDYLNQHGDHPKVKVIGRKGEMWIVDVYVKTNEALDEQHSLTQWLVNNELVWEEL